MTAVYLSEAQTNHESARHAVKQVVHATSPIKGTNMQPNNGGGFSFVIDDFGLLQRFIMIGATSAGYSTTVASQAKQGFEVVKKCIAQDAQAVIQMIVEISQAGRAPKNDSAIAALAVAATMPQSAELAWAALPLVCRTGTHLFQFVALYDTMGKWNAAAKRGIANWYNSRHTDRLAVQMLKYQQRNGWSHRDVLRLAHVKPVTDIHSAIYRKAARDEASELLPGLYDVVASLNKGDLTNSQVVNLVQDTRDLSWEMLPTKYLASADVLAALVPNMGMTALIRKLGALTSAGVLSSSEMSRLVAEKLTDKDALTRARIHPLMALQALKQYQLGRGDKGSLTWAPDARTIAALDDAFYLAFAASDNTDENYMVGIDISGSMRGTHVNGSPNLTADEVAVVMGMAAVRSQSNSMLYGFNSTLVDLKITANMSVSAAQAAYRRAKWDGASTNAGALFERALQLKLDVDKFVVVTDNDINTGSQPASLLKKYRKKSGGKGKLAVIATSLSQFSIADPDDTGMLDIAGFDSAAAQLIAAL